MAELADGGNIKPGTLKRPSAAAQRDGVIRGPCRVVCRYDGEELIEQYLMDKANRYIVKCNKGQSAAFENHIVKMCSLIDDGTVTTILYARWAINMLN